MMNKILLFALTFLLAACVPSSTAVLTVMCHDSFSISESVIADFELANDVEVVFLKAGDTGEALSKAILSADAPLADIFFGVDNTFLSRALEAGIFETYPSPLLASIPDTFELDPTYSLLPVDYGDVCINYDKAWFAASGLPIPTSLEDLTYPIYEGLFVVENPATSSPGLAFLMTTVAHFGDPGYLDYWGDLRANGVVVVDGWETAYYSNFSASSGAGSQPLVVSYGSSPPAEVYFAEVPLSEAPTASIAAPETCFRQIEFVGILRGTEKRELAERFIDFMLDVKFQEDLPLQMFVFPVHESASLPDVFIEYAQIPQYPVSIDPAIIAENREKWIDEWTVTVIK